MAIKKNFVLDTGLDANLASSFANTIVVTGNATFSNTILVTGNATFSNSISVSNITSVVTTSGLITATANASVALNVGANATINTSSVRIGNATSNSVITGTSITTSGTLTVGGNTIINGNLTVTGTTTYVNTSVMNIADNMINLNTDVVGAPSENAGIEINRGSSANVQFMWDETNDRWSTNNQPLTASALVNTTLQRYTEAVTVNTAIGSTYTIDLSTANIFDLTLTANVTFSMSNPPSSGTAQGATLLLRQDATGGRKVTFPSSFKWTDGDNANTYISTGANKIDVISIFTVDGGTVYLASQGMANVG